MSLFRRFNDMLTANLNDFVEKFEDPETMLRQAIREMDAALQVSLDAAAKAIASERLLARQIGEQHDDAALWQQKALSAVQRGDDEAARRALVRKQEHVTLAAALQDQLATATAVAAKLRRQVEAMRVRMEEARRMLLLLVARQRATQARRTLSDGLACGSPRDAGFRRFDRLRERVEQSEAELDAYLELSTGHSADEDFDDANCSRRAVVIETELAELKQSLATTGG
ncbi:MAG: PspA/IM30 family protein [Candidatus Saccharimonas sp.]|nr:PspA/IM30 family protein [Planctomycetaceae bacterium]